MKAKCIYKFLNELAPIELKMDFDNVGLLVGDPNAEVKSCLVALDITDTVIDEAVHKGAQLIVSHHPVIFEAMKSVLPDDEQGRKLIKLIKKVHLFYDHYFIIILLMKMLKKLMMKLC